MQAAAVAAPKPTAAQPAPERVAMPKVENLPPLTEEQLAAKSSVDDILKREPSLWAAKDRPDPELARLAAEKHRQQDLAKAKREADEARRRELAEKKLAEPQVAAANVRPQTQNKPAKSRSSAGHSDNRKPAMVASASRSSSQYSYSQRTQRR